MEGQYKYLEDSVCKVIGVIGGVSWASSANELCNDVVKEESRKGYVDIIKRLEKEGGEGVILGCTEIPLLIRQGDVDIPIFDTTELHSVAAIDYATRK